MLAEVFYGKHILTAPGCGFDAPDASDALMYERDFYEFAVRASAAIGLTSLRQTGAGRKIRRSGLPVPAKWQARKFRGPFLSPMNEGNLT